MFHAVPDDLKSSKYFICSALLGIFAADSTVSVQVMASDLWYVVGVCRLDDRMRTPC